MKTCMITGMAGFIGHHICEYLLLNTDWNIVGLDRLDCSGNLNRLVDLECWQQNKKRVKIVHHDLKAPINDIIRKQIGQVDYILHLAAGSHVDRSIENPLAFVMDNTVGTVNLLDYARKSDIDWMIYFSTDEVFGPAPPDVYYKEWDRYNSGNPYAASKAGAEEFCLAYHNTYQLPVIITHCMNVFGERQHPEKFIPLCIDRILKGRKIYVHADRKKLRPGSRFYIYTKNVAYIIHQLLINNHTVPGEKYNIVGEEEVDNLEIVFKIADIIDKDAKYELIDYHSSRPGHDLRYALDGTKLKEMGLNIQIDLDNSLNNVVKWYLKNQHWLGD